MAQYQLLEEEEETQGGERVESFQCMEETEEPLPIHQIIINSTRMG